MKYFTKAAIEELIKELAYRSVRDSDLPVTDKMYEGDFVAVVQDGINKKIDISNFIDEAYKGDPGESAFDILKRHGYPGTEDDWVEMMENLVVDADQIDNRLDALELAGATVTFTATPQVITPGTATTIVLALGVAGLGTSGATLLEILDSDMHVIVQGSGVGFSTQVQVSAASTFYGRVTHNTATRTRSLSISAVDSIYYGSGADTADFESNKVAYPNPTTTVARTYEVTVRHEGDYVFFMIPSSMTINNVTLGGFGFPMTLQSTSGGYKLYKSDNTYLAGTLTLVVS